MNGSRADFQRFAFVFIMIFTSILFVFGSFVGITDPFYQYHKPWFGMPVILEDAVYQTPGAARNLEYTDVIVGTSMTENFRTSWFDDELGWHTMKLSYSGARSDDLKAILSSVFSRKEPVRHIFMDINHYQLTVPGWTAYVKRPEYLYNGSWLDDAPYVFNRDVAAVGWERVLDALQGRKDNIDMAYTWEDESYFGAEQVLNLARDAREQLLTAPPVERPEENITTCDENLDNIIPFIEEHPDTNFIIFLPPYSMLYWEELLLSGRLENMLGIYRHAMERFLEYENVEVYYFQDERELITDLENYRDVAHHRPEYNRYIFECVREGRNRMTKENLEQAIRDMYDFACHYDYKAYWE